MSVIILHIIMMYSYIMAHAGNMRHYTKTTWEIDTIGSETKITSSELT